MDTAKKTILGRVSLVPRGTYNENISYKRLDVIEHEGSSFLALADFQGVVPAGDDVLTMFLSKRGLTVLGYYDTQEALKAEITSPRAGDAYGVGTEAPFDIFVWDKVHAKWVNNGPFRGKSAYQTWLEEGNTGSGQEFLTYMRGEEEVNAKLEQKVDKVKGRSLIAADLLSKITGLPDVETLESILGSKQNMLMAGNNLRITKVEGSEYLYRIDVNTMEIFKVCPIRPQVGEENKIYLIPKANVTDNVNRYDEYVWVNGGWDYIGTMAVEVDLSNYYAKDQINQMLADIKLLIEKKADKTEVATQIKDATNEAPVIDTLTEQDYVNVVKMISGVPSSGKTLLKNLAAALAPLMIRSGVIRTGGRNYVSGSRLNTTAGWMNLGGGTVSVVSSKPGNVINVNTQNGSDYQKVFDIPEIASLTNTDVVYYAIGKRISNASTDQFYFGKWPDTYSRLNSNSPKIDLGDEWFMYYSVFHSGATLGGQSFGFNSFKGEWQFYAVGVCKGTVPPSDWTPAIEEMFNV